MTFYYAQLNTHNIVKAVTQTSGQISRPDMVEIDGLNEQLLGMLYLGGEFVPYTPDE